MKALVTGAAGSIGRGITECVAEDYPYTVVVADLNLDAAESFAASLRGRGFPAEACALDVTDFDAVRATVDRLDQDDGIEVLVNVAGGIHDLRLPMFWETRREDWLGDVEVNLIGTMNVTYATLPHMLARGHGHIVNISSGKGLRAGPGQTAYSASKAGIIQFTRAIALETARRGLHVNSVAPGSTIVAWRQETPDEEERAANAIPLGRRITPREIGYAVSFLISERASHITGACLDTSGGVELH